MGDPWERKENKEVRNMGIPPSMPRTNMVREGRRFRGSHQVVILAGEIIVE